MSSVLELVEPAYLWVPEYSFTSAPEVVELCTEAKYAPDPEQELALGAVFAENPDATPAIREIEIIAARQNIKTGLQIQTIIGWMFVLDVEAALYTAHKWKTAEKTFTTLMGIVREAPFLMRRVYRFYEGNGEQKMMLKDGRYVEFATRTGSSGQGPARDKVILDEDFATQPVHVGALMPSLSTRPMAQLVRGSSAGHPESAALRDIRDRGRAGAIDPAKGDRFLAYFEWCMPDPAQACDEGERCDHGRTTPGCGLDKPELLAIANSQYGRRISPDHVAWERGTMTPAEFGRERGGWWDKPVKMARPPALDPEKFADLEDPDSKAAAVTAFGVDMDPDRTVTSIGMAGPRSDGLTHLEHIVKLEQASKVVARCKRLNKKHGPATFVVADYGQADTFAEALREAGLNVVQAKWKQVAEACAQLIDEMEAGSFRWRTHPDLIAAAAGARKWWRGKRFAFAPEDGAEEITALYGVLLARWLRDQLDYAVEDSIY